MEDYRANTYGDGFADVYDDWYGDVSDVDGTVSRITALADGRPVLELGVGTGRLALPLARRGVETHGIDASAAMIEQLKAKPGADAVTVTLADMADFPVPEPDYFGVVLIAFNTFFNLTSAAAQQACLERIVTALQVGGHLVIEAFIPSAPPARPAGALDVRSVEIDRVHLAATWRDPVEQKVWGQHIELTRSGVQLRPWLLRYVTPAELDAMTAAAGLELTDRSSDWHGAPIDESSSRHVSTYVSAGR